MKKKYVVCLLLLSSILVGCDSNSSVTTTDTIQESEVPESTVIEEESSMIQEETVEELTGTDTFDYSQQILFDDGGIGQTTNYSIFINSDTDAIFYKVIVGSATDVDSTTVTLDITDEALVKALKIIYRSVVSAQEYGKAKDTIRIAEDLNSTLFDLIEQTANGLDVNISLNDVNISEYDLNGDNQLSQSESILALIDTTYKEKWTIEETSDDTFVSDEVFLDTSAWDSDTQIKFTWSCTSLNNYKLDGVSSDEDISSIEITDTDIINQINNIIELRKRSLATYNTNILASLDKFSLEYLTTLVSYSDTDVSIVRLTTEGIDLATKFYNENFDSFEEMINLNILAD
jgi:uncharacterized lipoprotein NlpE involved in copper resistance